MINDINDISPEVHIVRRDISNYFSFECEDCDHVFTYIEKGSAEFIVSEKAYQLKAGSVIILPPFKPHIIKIKPNEPLVQWIIHFDFYTVKSGADSNVSGGIMPSYPVDFIDIKREQILAGEAICASLNSYERQQVVSCINSMKHEFENKTEYHELMLKSLMTELLCIQLRCKSRDDIGSQKKGKTWFSIERALTYIRDNYSNPDLSNEEISRAACLSVNYLANSFNDKLGLSVHEYVNKVRISSAKKMILAGDGNFTEIAKTVGFSSIHVFSKAFKRHEGCSPSEFLKLNS